MRRSIGSNTFFEKFTIQILKEVFSRVMSDEVMIATKRLTFRQKRGKGSVRICNLTPYNC